MADHGTLDSPPSTYLFHKSKNFDKSLILSIPYHVFEPREFASQPCCATTRRFQPLNNPGAVVLDLGSVMRLLV